MAGWDAAECREDSAVNNDIWPKRLFALDISRFFAALAVILWHWQHFAYNGSSLSENFERSQQPLYAIFRISYEKGFMGVDYFFLLSGFIFFWLYRSSIEDRRLSLGNFWVQRISRLYPLHVVTLSIIALLQILYTLHNGKAFVYSLNDLYHFFLNLAFASNWGFEKGPSFNAPVWSVSIEILLYCLFFISAYARLGRPWFYLGVSIIAFVITLFLYTDIFNGISLFFLGGVVFYITLIVSTRMQKVRVIIYLITVISWVLTIVNFYVFNVADFMHGFGLFGQILLTSFPHYVLFPFTVCSLALFEIDRGIGFLKSVSWIGDITYSSYLLHFPLQVIFAMAVGYKFLSSDFYLSPIYLVIFFSILIPLSYVTFIRFERPAQKIIRSKFGSRLTL